MGVDSLVKSIFGGGDKPDIPAVTAESTAKTAKRVEPVSDLARRNKRRQASLLTEGFAPPKLAKPGLLGLGV